MTDEPSDSPNHGGQPPRQPQPGELLFEFVRESDRAHFRCELRTHDLPVAFEVQFFMDGEPFIAQRFEHHDLALEWAELEREAIQKAWTA